MKKFGNGIKVGALLAVIAVCAGVTLWCTFGSADPSSGPRRMAKHPSGAACFWEFQFLRAGLQ